MQHQIPVLESQLLFDSKPLDKRVQQQQNDLMIRYTKINLGKIYQSPSPNAYRHTLSVKPKNPNKFCLQGQDLKQKDSLK